MPITDGMNAKKRDRGNEPPVEQEHPHVYVSPVWRVVVHVWVIVHLLALIAAPLTFATMGAPAPQMLFDVTRPYVDLLFLDHGYAFFAPEVGPNHLVEYRIEREGESEAEIKRFPSLDDQWPRLLYHRHFMLSETLHARFAPDDLPQDFFPDREEYERWRAQRSMFVKLRDSFASHLAHEHAANEVEIVRIEHRQPHPPEFDGGLRLNDDSLYQELPDTLQLPPAVGPQPGPLGPPFPFPYAPAPGPVEGTP